MSSLSYSIFVLRGLGVWYCNRELRGWKAKIYVGYSIFIFGIMYSFTLSQYLMLNDSLDDVNDFTDALFMLVMLSVICSKMINMIVKRKIIAGMMKVLESNLFSPQDSEESAINSKSSDNIKFCTLMYGIMTESTCTMLTLASFNRDIPRKELPYKAWLPFSITTNTTFWIAYLHQTLGLYIAANMDIGFDSLVIDMMMVLCVQLKILKHRFNIINQTIKSIRDSYDFKFTKKEKLYLEKKLIANCIKHHIAIFELSKETFGVSVFLQYCAGSLILCASTFSVSQLKPFSADFVALIIYVMCILIQIFIYCRYANELTLESQSISNAIYATDWTSLSVSSQQSLIIIMSRELHPIKYTVGHITLSLASFTQLIKLSYSAYNVLQQSSQ
ncbi:hypothetical protein PV325_014086 [Microctonus aethiopoides]|nr:hypothetical protein PV325_014086 [Microctonus aethiopoides]